MNDEKSPLDVDRSSRVGGACSDCNARECADFQCTRCPWKRLSTAGYDLNTAQGAHAFIARLNGAAIAVCSQEMHNEVIAGTDYSHYYNLCRREALAAALRNINKPLLTEAFRTELPVDAAAMGITSANALAAR
jgi:UrcA family protein